MNLYLRNERHHTNENESFGKHDSTSPTKPSNEAICISACENCSKMNQYVFELTNIARNESKYPAAQTSHSLP